MFFIVVPRRWRQQAQPKQWYVLQITWHSIPEDCSIHVDHCDNLESHISMNIRYCVLNMWLSSVTAKSLNFNLNIFFFRSNTDIRAVEQDDCGCPRENVSLYYRTHTRDVPQAPGSLKTHLLQEHGQSCCDLSL